MKLRTIFQWLFVYLPLRFTIPFLGLLAWFLFYLWPWLLDLFFVPGVKHDFRDAVRGWFLHWLVPGWIEALNLTPAAEAAAILALLAAGLLLAYNLSALCYGLIRRWDMQTVLFSTVVLNVFIYSYPWIFAPKDWAESNFFAVPYYLRLPWINGFSDYGFLWALPGATILGTFAFAFIFPRQTAKKSEAEQHYSMSEPPPIENPTFDHMRQEIEQSGAPLRIGLILAGGGAKGVYQAGAMRAIYEFLKQRNCLDNVKMVAGTSIGSWNSLFWLGGMLESHSGRPSAHEQWWESVNIERIVAFSPYLPLLNNSILNTQPWHEEFNRLFGEDRLGGLLNSSAPMHFYLTRSNVAQGRLEFTTNWGAAQRQRAESGNSDIQINSFTEAKTIADIRDGVFASMDLPPLFPYQVINGKYYEDGGVVDNLPVRFGTAIEECDLLFVISLNCSFEEIPDQHSLIVRLMRVLDVRQGVLERNSMRLTYLYNQLAHARKGSTNGKHNYLRVFAVCPQTPLQVNTGVFWKTDVFPGAFHTMYEGTRVALNDFDFNAIPGARPSSKRQDDWLSMALVSPTGEVTYTDRF
jgi:predicted acylesterase/phospholipase RssA